MNPVISKWIHHNPDIVDRILAVARDPSYCPVWIRNSVIFQEVIKAVDIDEKVLKSRISTILNLYPEEFEPRRGRSNAGDRVWRRRGV